MAYPSEWDDNPAYDLHRENYKRQHPKEYPEEGHLLHEILKEERRLERKDDEILRDDREILDALKRKLTVIKVSFKGDSMATPVAGPITLVTVGATATASVLGYDQFGAPFTGTIPTPTFSASDTAGAIATFDPTTGLVTAVANGTDSITATLTTAEGLALTDTEVVTVAIPVVPPPTPVLSSIKVAFA